MHLYVQCWWVWDPLCKTCILVSGRDQFKTYIDAILEGKWVEFIRLYSWSMQILHTESHIVLNKQYDLLKLHNITACFRVRQSVLCWFAFLQGLQNSFHSEISTDMSNCNSSTEANFLPWFFIFHSDHQLHNQQTEASFLPSSGMFRISIRTSNKLCILLQVCRKLMILAVRTEMSPTMALRH